MTNVIKRTRFELSKLAGGGKKILDFQSWQQISGAYFSRCQIWDVLTVPNSQILLSVPLLMSLKIISSFLKELHLITFWHLRWDSSPHSNLGYRLPKSRSAKVTFFFRLNGLSWKKTSYSQFLTGFRPILPKKIWYLLFCFILFFFCNVDKGTENFWERTDCTGSFRNRDLCFLPCL